MKLFARLALGFGILVVTFAATGAVILKNLDSIRSAESRVRARIQQNDLALGYRQGSQEATLGASQLASGNPIGEQRVREGLRVMEESREELTKALVGADVQAELRELKRVELLTRGATERVVHLVREKAESRLIQQELTFLSARADALSLRLDALFDDSRDEVRATLKESDALGALVQKQTTFSIFGGIFLSIIVSLWVFRSIQGPLAKLDHGVRRIQDGDLSHDIEITSKDEIGDLTVAFNQMTGGLRDAISALDGCNRDMRIVLDNVSQGLLMLGRDGHPKGERSQAAEALLGSLDTNVAFWTQMEASDPRFAAHFEACWDQIIDDFMPLDVALGQLPRSFKSSGRYLEFDYLPISDLHGLDKLLLVISDVTDRVQSEKARVKDQEMMAIFLAIQRDRQGFLDFFAEGTALVETMSTGSLNDELDLLKRQLHTLKGNALIFGLVGIGASCHALEDTIAETESAPPADLLALLATRWSELKTVVTELTGENTAHIELNDNEFRSIIDAILLGRARKDVAKMIAKYRLEPTTGRLSRIAEQARTLGKRLGKGEIEVRQEHHGVRLPRDRFTPFWNSLIHAVRNAVDHGLESPEERSRLGKGPGMLTLSTIMTHEEFLVELTDNGRGVDWEKIASKAREHDLPADSQEDLVQALFSDGVSTAGAVSEISGRGVGMSALRDACSSLGGRILVQSVRNEGTIFSFRFPVAIALDETIIEITKAQVLTSLMPGSEIFPSSVRTDVRISRV